MKKEKIIYWVTSVVLALMFAFSSFLYLTKNPELVENFKKIGFPESFVMILGTAKLLAAIAFVVPVWNRAKDWAYAGTSFVLIGAVWVHLATQTPFVMPLLALSITAISYWAGIKLNSKESQ
jgi:hypothetical protein